jgi:hypothetical protein
MARGSIVRWTLMQMGVDQKYSKKEKLQIARYKQWHESGKVQGLSND